MTVHRTAKLYATDEIPRIDSRLLSRFLASLGVVFLIFAVFCGLSVAVLIANLENVSPVEAARMQFKSGGLYGSALVYRPYPYKLELYRLEKPDVAIVGSSRAMGFVNEGFAASMTNLGGAVNEVLEAEKLIPDMLAVHHPKLLLLTLDFWWFNAARYDDVPPESQSEDVTFTLRDILSPAKWLWGGEIKLSVLFKTMFSASGAQPLIGLDANQTHSGFDRNGTRFYGAMLTGTQESGDHGFRRTLARLKDTDADSKFSMTAPFSEPVWLSLMRVARMARDAGVEVRFIVPPLAGPVFAALRSKAPRSILDELHDHLARSGFKYYDFSDPATIDASDCEFVDGFHGGFVAYLRILRQVSQDMEDRPDLRALIQPDSVLKDLIDKNVGRATLRGNPWVGQETDYLGLGCPKA